ncbi:MAG: sigma-70 family RNA polymerase sigma factor [Lachnospiraceae bacterium]|nr:sigma-70 family RNA polymerase sigma factor [Lachnospiraceae bacterium]
MKAEFEKVYREQRDAVYGYLLYMTGDEQMTQDLVQETFLKIYLNLHRFRQESSMKTWCIAIAKNTYLSYLKKKRPETVEEKFGFQVADGKPLPEEKIILEEKNNLIRQVLFSMKEDERQLLLLRDYEKLSYKEIGELIGVSEIVVKGRIYRAREHYKKKYRQMADKWEAE